MRGTSSLPQRGRPSKGSIPLTPDFLDHQPSESYRYMGLSQRRGEASENVEILPHSGEALQQPPSMSIRNPSTIRIIATIMPTKCMI